MVVTGVVVVMVLWCPDNHQLKEGSKGGCLRENPDVDRSSGAAEMDR